MTEGPDREERAPAGGRAVPRQKRGAPAGPAAGQGGGDSADPMGAGQSGGTPAGPVAGQEGGALTPAAAGQGGGVSADLEGGASAGASRGAASAFVRQAGAALSGFFRLRGADQRFASIAAMERAARRRIPTFAYDYMAGGIGAEIGLARNRAELDRIRFMPRYLAEVEPPRLPTSILGRKVAAPFGAAPVGLTGLMWPDAPKHIARAAAAANLPVGLSTYGTASIEEVGAIAGPLMWFQLYPLRDEAIEEDLLARFAAVGGEVLVVTVDIPGPTRRERDIGNGLSVPPRRDWRTWAQCAARPGWSLAMLRAGEPEFRNITRYVPRGTDRTTALEFLGSIMAAHVSPQRLRRYRDLWKGKLVVKGVLGVEDARVAAECGADGVVVSNHGGRQLDGAPTAPEVLPAIRDAVDDRMAVLADGGVRSGLDVARLLAKGADFVLLGRAMTFSVAGMGAAGPAHALHVLAEELRCTLGQVGCSDPRRLGAFLHEEGGS